MKRFIKWVVFIMTLALLAIGLVDLLIPVPLTAALSVLGFVFVLTLLIPAVSAVADWWFN